jgi:hypothetical protein
MKKLIFLSSIFIVLTITFTSCSKSSSEETASATPVLPSISTTIVTDITQTTVTVRGNVSNDGNTTLIARGFCFAISENPTLANSKTTEIGTTGTFTSSLISLIPNTLYYLRAYATNSVGTTYGNQISFTTLDVATFLKFKYKNIQYSFSAETYDNQKKEIRGYQGINAQYKKMGIWMPLSPTVGIHNVTYDNSNPSSYEGHFVSQAEGLYLDGTTGTINITSVTSTKIEGTFQFSGIDSNGVAVTITEGTFKANRS